MRDYHINVFYSEQDGAYIADVPDLEVCTGVGRTPEAALQAVLKAKNAWVQTAQAEGRPVPQPHYRPALYAGRINYHWG